MLQNQNKITLSNLIFIPFDSISLHLLEDIKRKLTFQPEDDTYGKPKPITLYKEDSVGIGLPKFFVKDIMGFLLLESGQDNKISMGYPIDVEFKEEKQRQNENLFQRQERVINSIHKYFFDALVAKAPFVGCIYEAPTGSGKTVVAIKLLTKLKCTTLILVEREFLKEQWKDRLLQYTDLKEDDIGIIQGSTCEYKNKKVCIGMIQSLCSRKYPPEVYNYFGFIIVDEIHHLGAEKWSQVGLMFNCYYSIGLSATPNRKDGLDALFEYTIGTRYFHFGDWYVKPTIKIYSYPLFLDLKAFTYRGQLSLPRLITKITNIQSYNKFLVNLVYQYVKTGHKIMLLSERVKHLKELDSLFKQLCPEYSSALFVGGIDDTIRQNANNYDVLFATYSYAGEGLDLPHLTAIILATPRADIRQTLGRLLRDYTKEKPPLVIDIRHKITPVECGLLVGMFKKRINLYRTKGYTILKENENSPNLTPKMFPENQKVLIK